MHNTVTCHIFAIVAPVQDEAVRRLFPDVVQNVSLDVYSTKEAITYVVWLSWQYCQFYGAAQSSG